MNIYVVAMVYSFRITETWRTPKTRRRYAYQPRRRRKAAPIDKRG